MDTLQVDLNEIVSKEIQSKIKAYKKRINSLKEENAKLQNQILPLQKQIDDHSTSLALFNMLRDEFSKISSTEKTDDDFEKPKAQNQFSFIEKVLLNLYRIKRSADGWYAGSLAVNLAVNYYFNKDTVINLLRIIKPDSEKEISFISSFVMPFDYSKEKVISYVTNPRYNTNGCIYGISQYWVGYGAGENNMPHDLIMKSDLILEDDVFAMLLNTIQKRTTSEFHWLFALPKYNKKISIEQLQKLGECLLGLTERQMQSQEVKSFVRDNLKSFNNKTLELLYSQIKSDNNYAMLHWENFPNEFQAKFIKSKSLEEVLKIFSGYNCSWTIEQKETFLKEYFTDAR